MQIVEGIPTPQEYAAMRADAGWETVDPDVIARGLDGSLASFVVRDDDGELIGMGRLVGDGAAYLYLQDVIVRSDLRGKGLGTELTRRLLSRAQELGGRGTFVGLMAARGAGPFYRRFGFEERPGDRPGMWRVLDGA